MIATPAISRRIISYALLTSLVTFNFVLSQTQNVQKLNEVLSQLSVRHDTVKVDSLLERFNRIRYSDPAFAYDCVNEALRISQKVKYEIGEARAHGGLGTMASMKGDFLSSLDHYKKARVLFSKLNMPVKVAAVLNNMASAEHNMGNYSRAIEMNLASLRIKEKLNDTDGIGYSYSNLGEIYRKLQNYEVALVYYRKALAIRNQLTDSRAVANNCLNMGIVYSNRAEYDSALYYYGRAEQLFLKAKDKFGLSSCYINKAIISKKTGDFKSAMDFYDKALQLNRETGHRQGEVLALINIGSMYKTRNKFAAAEKCYTEAISIAKNIRYKEGIKDISSYLYSLCERSGRYKESLQHFKNYTAYRDSLVNEEATKKQVRLEMQYAFEKKSAADSVRVAEDKKRRQMEHEEEIGAQKLYTYYGAGGFVLMLIIAGISFYAFSNKKKANIEIARQKNLVDENQKEILDSIYYARRIQSALITSEFYFIKTLKRLNPK